MTTYSNVTFLFYLISECVKYFRGEDEIEVKRGKEVCKTTPAHEANRQVEIFVSNAKTRLKRKRDSQQKDVTDQH